MMKPFLNFARNTKMKNILNTIIEFMVIKEKTDIYIGLVDSD